LIINQGKLVLSDVPEKIPTHINQTNDLTIKAKGQKQTLKGLIDKLEHVTQSKILNTGEPDVYQLEISSLSEYDLREEIFYLFAGAKCPILEMNLKVPTLEEVFLRLTGEGTKQYGGKMSKDEKKKMKAKLDMKKHIAKKKEDSRQEELVQEPEQPVDEVSEESVQQAETEQEAEQPAEETIQDERSK
jgi:ABC-2 type transport system ATP-binding protein